MLFSSMLGLCFEDNRSPSLNFSAVDFNEGIPWPPSFFGSSMNWEIQDLVLIGRSNHWETWLLIIQSRVRYTIGLLVYKCLHGLAPQYLSDYCAPVQVSFTRSSLRSARFQERLLAVPRTKTKTIGPLGFFHASPTVWNSLPDDLRDPVLSIGCFRNKLKTFLFQNLMQMQINFFVVHLLKFNFILIPFILPCAPMWYLLAGAFKMSWLIDWLIDNELL